MYIIKVIEMNNRSLNSTPVNNGLNGHTTYWYQPIQTVHNNIVVPEIDNRQNIPEYLKMNNAECLKLLTLLSDWKMSFLFRTLYGKNCLQTQGVVLVFNFLFVITYL